MKVFKFKFLTTALFLLLALFAAGFAGNAEPDTFAQPETVSVQQTVEDESFGDGFVLLYEADGMIPA